MYQDYSLQRRIFNSLSETYGNNLAYHQNSVKDLLNSVKSSADAHTQPSPSETSSINFGVIKTNPSSGHSNSNNTTEVVLCGLNEDEEQWVEEDKDSQKNCCEAWGDVNGVDACGGRKSGKHVSACKKMKLMNSQKQVELSFKNRKYFKFCSSSWANHQSVKINQTSGSSEALFGNVVGKEGISIDNCWQAFQGGDSDQIFPFPPSEQSSEFISGVFLEHTNLFPDPQKTMFSKNPKLTLKPKTYIQASKQTAYQNFLIFNNSIPQNSNLTQAPAKILLLNNDVNTLYTHESCSGVGCRGACTCGRNGCCGGCNIGSCNGDGGYVGGINGGGVFGGAVGGKMFNGVRDGNDGKNGSVDGGGGGNGGGGCSGTYFVNGNFNCDNQKINFIHNNININNNINNINTIKTNNTIMNNNNIFINNRNVNIFNTFVKSSVNTNINDSNIRSNSFNNTDTQRNIPEHLLHESMRTNYENTGLISMENQLLFSPLEVSQNDVEGVEDCVFTSDGALWNAYNQKAFANNQLACLETTSVNAFSNNKSNVPKHNVPSKNIASFDTFVPSQFDENNPLQANYAFCDFDQGPSNYGTFNNNFNNAASSVSSFTKDGRSCHLIENQPQQRNIPPCYNYTSSPHPNYSQGQNYGSVRNQNHTHIQNFNHSTPCDQNLNFTAYPSHHSQLPFSHDFPYSQNLSQTLTVDPKSEKLHLSASQEQLFHKDWPQTPPLSTSSACITSTNTEAWLSRTDTEHDDLQGVLKESVCSLEKNDFSDWNPFVDQWNESESIYPFSTELLQSADREFTNLWLYFILLAF